MLSGLKFILRDHIDKEKDETSNDSQNWSKRPEQVKEKLGRKNKHSHYSSSEDEGLSSSEDEGLEKIKRGSRKKKKWYDSKEGLSSSFESGSQRESDGDQKRYKIRKREKKRRDGKSDTEHKSRSKKKAKSKRIEYSSESGSENERSSGEGSHHRGDSKGSKSQDFDIVRKQMGLEWMLRPKDNNDNISSKSSHIEPEGVSAEEVKKENPRELKSLMEGRLEIDNFYLLQLLVMEVPAGGLKL